MITTNKKLSEITDNEFYKEGLGRKLIDKYVSELISLCLKHKIPFVYEPHNTCHYDRIKVKYGDKWLYTQINPNFYWRNSYDECPIDELIEKIKQKYDNNR